MSGAAPSPDRLHFVGIGGAGMAPLALLAQSQGYVVSGSDREANSKTAELLRHGIQVTVGHAAANLPPTAGMLIYSSAVPEDNPERVEASRRRIVQIRRGEFLALLARRYRRVAAVSGAHGKSSTTALLAHILIVAGKSPAFLIGAKMTGYGSFSPGSGSDIFVTEVDESDGTHTFIRAELGIVPNIEEDHAWSVGGAAVLMDNFAAFGRHCNHLIYYPGEHPDRIFSEHPSAERLENPPTEYAGFFGFQAVNARIAVAAAEHLGVPRDRAEAAVRSFPGIGRRMTVRYDSPELTVIEDYAHHPSEIAAAVDLLRHRYPGRHLRVLIQPHRYARLEYFFDGFKRELAKADSVLVTSVFAAWSESGKIDGAALAAALPNATYAASGWEETAKLAVEPPCPARPLLLAVLGAGDIERVFAHLPGRGA
jgi:UDP-N-acetylmuramate--alanine ligase